jgi:hypothetical protein
VDDSMPSFERKNKIIVSRLKLIVFGQILTKFGNFGQFWTILGKFS